MFPQLILADVLPRILHLLSISYSVLHDELLNVPLLVTLYTLDVALLQFVFPVCQHTGSGLSFFLTPHCFSAYRLRAEIELIGFRCPLAVSLHLPCTVQLLTVLRSCVVI